ncbi:MAG: MFS transporter [Bacteroidia bacterium]|nr:MFS transporter [Bacteroidia bacterium]MCF8425100.1 MFS transporter [Bacteroidia bacterium]MCF8446633.1 MFS transporter [Bacteroidia bacterium]
MEQNKRVALLIIVAALGYFVDIYDLIVFNVVKNESLQALGFSGEALKEKEILLFNLQMTGMLLGGIIWGILGDKKGRVSVLFGSIFLYSIANIVNAFVVNINQYAIMRFIAGIGLAGELGAGITLVAENMPKEKRGYGTMIIVTFGALGAVVAGLVGKSFGWQSTYIVGGCLGLGLLLMRAGAYESGMYQNLVQHGNIKRGNFFSLFQRWDLFLKYLACILIGLPIWYAIGVLVNLSNRFAEAHGMVEKVNIADSVMYAYLGLSLGDLLSGLLSQLLKSRKKVVFIYLGLSLILMLVFLYNSNVGVEYYKWMCFGLGFATGYWALFVTIASEQFGTNIRSTVTNTVPNFVRGAVVPITLSFAALSKSYGVIDAALWVGLVCLGLAFFATLYIKDSFSKDLNYFELD